MQKPAQAQRPIFTYQARPVLDAQQAAVLDTYADLYGRAERSLFADLQAGGTINDLKRVFLPRFGITARQFNAIRVSLEGKIDSIKARRPELISDLESRIKKAAKVIAKLILKPSAAAKLHQKKRRLHILQAKLASMQTDHKAGLVRLCFGSKRLFNAQFDLVANDYASHADWKADWQASRANQIFVLGSQDETAGNQSCQATLAADGTIDLQLRLPDAMQQAHGKHLAIKGARFAYGNEAITAALASSQRIASTTRAGKPTVKRIGSALSYRFVRDDKGWRVFVSCEAAPVKTTTRSAIGSIGVDINSNHLAVSELDRFGNLVEFHRIDLHTYGKSTDQAKALIGDAAVAVVELASKAGKPLVIEKLDFAKKKAELENTDARQARMLSSFACNKVIAAIKAAAFRAGVDVIEVNPAYTSVIGAVNHAQKNGVSVHIGAAVAIARRGLGLSERLAVPRGLPVVVPVRSGGHITFPPPVRMRGKHVWSQWSKVRTCLKAAHVAHGRSGVPQGRPAPLAPATRPLGAIRPVTVQSREVNRQHNCSAGVMEDGTF